VEWIHPTGLHRGSKASELSTDGFLLMPTRNMSAFLHPFLERYKLATEKVVFKLIFRKNEL
jgi:hypothetical protein